MKVLRAASRVSEPWKNGGGRTAVVDRDADWRVSIAELRDGTPFSRFDGISRSFMPISRGGVVLSINGRERRLDRLEPVSFEGEDSVCAVGVSEPLEAVNLMWTRGRCRGQLTAISVAGVLELRAHGQVLVGILTAGRMVDPGGPELNRLDALALETAEAATLCGGAQLAVARIQVGVTSP